MHIKQSYNNAFKACLEHTIQIYHESYYSLSGLYYDVKHLVSMDKTVPVVRIYMAVIYHDHSVVEGRQWFS